MTKVFGILLFKGDSVFKNIGILALGEVLGRVLGIVTLPIITRIYSPEDLGALSIFNSIVLILIPFGTLKYSNAIVLPKTNEFAFNLSFLSFLLNFVFTILISVLLFFFNDYIFNIIQASQIISYWMLIPITVFLVNLYEIFYNWALRNNDYKLISTTKPIQSVVGEVTKIALGFFEIKPLGLIVGSIFSRSGGIYMLSSRFRKDFRKLRQFINIGRIRFLFYFYSDFPKFRLSSFFLFTLSTQLIPIIVTYLYGTYSNGQVGLALMVLALPISLIGQSISQVYYNEISKIKNYHTNELFDFTLKIAKKLLLFSLFPFSFVFLFSEYMFSFIFGDEWKLAGKYSSLLSFFLLTQFIASPLMNVYIVIKKQYRTLIIHAIRLFIILIILLLSLYLDLSIERFLLLYSIFLSLHYAFVIINLFTTIKKLKKDEVFY